MEASSRQPGMPLSGKRCGLRVLASVAPGDTVLAACRSRLLFTLPNSPFSILRALQPARNVSCGGDKHRLYLAGN